MFVRIGDKLLNLSHVQSIHIERDIVEFCFNSEVVIIKRDDFGTYEEIVAWINKQPRLTRNYKGEI